MHKTFFDSAHQHCSIDLDDGNATVPCFLVDISEFHATIECSVAAHIPDQFILLLTQDGHVARKCEIVDRSNKKLKVRLLGTINRTLPANDALLID